MTKAETAAWLGYGDDIAAMDRDHDPLHLSLCRFAQTESLSLRMGHGETLSDAERATADLEENAVLHVQRWLRRLRT